jgi:DUF177 domain-containing protein
MSQDSDSFRIYVDRLYDGHVEVLDEEVPPDFLEVHERDLTFNDPLFFKGEAYIAQDDLILHLSISTYATIPCSICNEPVKVEIKELDFYQAEPLKEIKSGIYNFKELMREVILLDAPSFAECNQGNCPRRKDIEKYLKVEGERDNQYHPFADLE